MQAGTGTSVDAKRPEVEQANPSAGVSPALQQISVQLNGGAPPRPPASRRAFIRSICALAVAMLINASNSAVFKFLQQRQPAYVYDCNVLCATNLVGLATLPLLFRGDLTWLKIKAITKWKWGSLFIGTLLFQVVGPYFFLKGLSGTSVSLAAVLARLDQVEFYVLSIPLLKERVNAWDVAVNSLTLLAVVLAVITSPAFGAPITLNPSNIWIILSTFGYSGSLLISKRFLTSVPVGIVAIFRLLVGTAAFHLYVFATGGATGAAKVFAPQLWESMWWYGLLYVTIFQACWLYVLANVSAPLISIGSSSRFPMTVIFGLLIIQDMPSGSSWVGATVMTASLLVGVTKIVREMRTSKAPVSPPDEQLVHRQPHELRKTTVYGKDKMVTPT